MWQPPERIKHGYPDPGWPTADEAERSRLFSPVDIGPLTARQRTWVPAMVPWRATEEGFVTDNVIDWYSRFGRGKPGVIVVEATGIRDIPSGPLLRIGHDRFVDGLSRLTRAVQEASEGESLLFIQIIDFLTIRRRPTKAKYFGRYLAITNRHRDQLADVTGQDWATAGEEEVREALLGLDDARYPEVLTERELQSLEYGYRESVNDLHLPHIRELPEVLPGLFADAAARALDSGFHGVELHFAHAYTMASFLSRRNVRDDGYGGSRQARARLPLEVIAEVRDRIGDDRVLGCRFLGDEVIEGGSDVDDACYYGVELARAGLDFLSLSKGGKFEDAKQPKVGWAAYPYTGQSGYECMPTIYSDERGPFGRNADLAAAVRGAVREAGHTIPVVAAGGIGTFAMAEEILRDEKADIVAAARQSLADPDWWLKMKLGRGDEIRRCQFTNYCEALDQKHKTVTCQLWDRVDLDAPDAPLDARGKRRLIAPPWRPE
jgi:2,4-dienoyl-CoA reductase-like NADH-dependent reductase (Old Yellow Enzyme family)